MLAKLGTIQHFFPSQLRVIGASGVPILDGPVDSYSYVTRCHVVFGSANGVIMVMLSDTSAI